MKRRTTEAKRKHWQGARAIFGPEAASVLEFGLLMP